MQISLDGRGVFLDMIHAELEEMSTRGWMGAVPPNALRSRQLCRRRRRPRYCSRSRDCDRKIRRQLRKGRRIVVVGTSGTSERSSLLVSWLVSTRSGNESGVVPGSGWIEFDLTCYGCFDLLQLCMHAYASV